MEVFKQPGTLSVAVRDSSGAAQRPDAIQQQALPPPFASDVSLGGLQLDLWDDERRRLSGGRLSDGHAADGSAGQPAQQNGSQAGTAQRGLPQQLGARVFCISLDGLGLAVLRRHTPGSGLSSSIKLETYILLCYNKLTAVVLMLKLLQVSMSLLRFHVEITTFKLPRRSWRRGVAAADPGDSQRERPAGGQPPGRCALPRHLQVAAGASATPSPPHLTTSLPVHGGGNIVC